MIGRPLSRVARQRSFGVLVEQGASSTKQAWWTFPVPEVALSNGRDLLPLVDSVANGHCFRIDEPHAADHRREGTLRPRWPIWEMSTPSRYTMVSVGCCTHSVRVRVVDDIP